MQVRNLVAKLVQYAADQQQQMLESGMGQSCTDIAPPYPGAWPPSPSMPPLLPTLSPKLVGGSALAAAGVASVRGDIVHSSMVSVASSYDRFSASPSGSEVEDDEAGDGSHERAAGGQDSSVDSGGAAVRPQTSDENDYDLDNALDELDREIGM